MQLEPLGSRVIIARDAADTATEGGILLPDTAKEKAMQGVVIAVGPGKMLDSGERERMLLQPGDRVLFNQWAGNDLCKIGVKDVPDNWLMCDQIDVLAKLVADDAPPAVSEYEQGLRNGIASERRRLIEAMQTADFLESYQNRTCALSLANRNRTAKERKTVNRLTVSDLRRFLEPFHDTAEPEICLPDGSTLKLCACVAEFRRELAHAGRYAPVFHVEEPAPCATTQE